MKIQALGDHESLDTSEVCAEQEGALITLRINETNGATADATLTPGQADALADELKEIAKEARDYVG